jgi:hypothetical protein
MGLRLPEHLLRHLQAGAGGAATGAAEEDEEQALESDEEVEEVSGYHFIECTALFVSYVYITSG